MRISDWSSDVCSSDLTTHRIVVEPWLKALHPQRIPVAADVGIARSKQAQAGSVATRCIGKRHRAVFARVAAMRDPFLIQQLVCGQIKYPPTRLGGRPGIIDHRQPTRGVRTSAVEGK